MIDFKREKLIFTSGLGKLPSNTLSGKLYEVVCVGLWIDVNNGLIKYVSSTLKNQVVNDFISTLLLNHHIEEDHFYLLKDLKERYWGVTEKAVIAAVKNAQKNYLNHKKLNKN
jgi:hypothetical protein